MSVVGLGAAACGGKIEGDGIGNDGDPTTSSIPSSSTNGAEDRDDEAGEPPLGGRDVAVEEDGEWGTWQLLSIESADGKRDYEPPFIELDLHPNGEAYTWQCALSLTGKGERCPPGLRTRCHVGTMSLHGTTWRIQVHDKEGTRVVGRGDVRDEPSGDIAVNGEGVLPAGGHYRRIASASREGCTP